MKVLIEADGLVKRREQGEVFQGDVGGMLKMVWLLSRVNAREDY